MSCRAGGGGRGLPHTPPYTTLLIFFPPSSHTAQDHTLVLPWDLSDVTVAGALDPYRRKYRHIHVRAPVARLLRRFEDAGLQAEFDAVSGKRGD